MTSEDDIKNYQKALEKNEIYPGNMPHCAACNTDSSFFKLHGYRERQFLNIINMMVTIVFCTLVRFRCPGCGKTFTFYPDFAIPYKRYTRQSIVEFSSNYTEHDEMTYRKAIMMDHEVPGYEDKERTLSHSTLYRWITTLGGYFTTCQKAMNLLFQEKAELSLHRELAQLTVSERKFRSEKQRECLVNVRKFIRIEACFQSVFGVSVFTSLARNCFYT
jgi:hypothetical protein